MDLLAFGFPLDFDRSCPLKATEINHASATAYSDYIDKYLQDEIQFGAIYGPFNSKPFPLHVSPFMTRENSGTTKSRAIVVLSWPHGLPLMLLWQNISTWALILNTGTLLLIILFKK